MKKANIPQRLQPSDRAEEPQNWQTNFSGTFKGIARTENFEEKPANLEITRRVLDSPRIQDESEFIEEWGSFEFPDPEKIRFNNNAGFSLEEIEASCLAIRISVPVTQPDGNVRHKKYQAGLDPLYVAKENYDHHRVLIEEIRWYAGHPELMPARDLALVIYNLCCYAQASISPLVKEEAAEWYYKYSALYLRLTNESYSENSPR